MALHLQPQTCNFSEFFFELKIIEMTCLLILFKLSYKGLGRLLKKITVRLTFRKVAFLEPATLLEMVFTSQVFCSIFIKLFRTFLFTKTPTSACYSINFANTIQDTILKDTAPGKSFFHP